MNILFSDGTAHLRIAGTSVIIECDDVAECALVGIKFLRLSSPSRKSQQPEKKKKVAPVLSRQNLKLTWVFDVIFPRGRTSRRTNLRSFISTELKHDERSVKAKEFHIRKHGQITTQKGTYKFTFIELIRPLLCPSKSHNSTS